ncbi:MAG: carboxypeptidase regulatory-like domain-containing protein [Cyanobacteria bacterium P01_A01_bin.84]
MFYPALPPAPPPIILNLTFKSVAQKSLGEKENKSQAQVNKSASTCKYSTILLSKPDITTNLLEKNQAVSDRKNLLPCLNSKNKNKSLANSITEDVIEQNIKSKGNITAERFSEQDKQINIQDKIQNNNSLSIAKNIPDNSNSNQPEKKDRKVKIPKQVSATIPPDKIAKQNTMGKFLATVQELINTSLYASVDSNVDSFISKPDNIQSNNQLNNKSENIQDNQDTVITASKEVNYNNQNPDNQVTTKKSNSDNQEIAIQINQNRAKLIAIIQDLIANSISNSLSQSQNIVNVNHPKTTELASTTNHEINDNKQPVKQKFTQNPSEGKPEDNTTINIRQRLAQRNKNKNQEIGLNPPIQLAQRPGEPFLVGVMINGREIGTLDIVQESNTLYVPLESFAELARLTIEESDSNLKIDTPLGLVEISPDSLKSFNGLAYISKDILKEKFSINIELNTADLTLLADLPWRAGSQQARKKDIELNPEFFAPRNGISSFKQELSIYNSGENSSLRSSTQIGGRLFGGAFRLRMNNNFDNEPNISEYFFYKRNGQFRYQIGRQRVGLHPLLNGVGLTGIQFGYSNLPSDRFNSSYSANELLPRRSQPVQTFRGQAPPASFVQLRIGGAVVTQQQVGFDGKYEFIDVRLPVGQTNEIELVVFDRNNLRVPREIRSIRLNASDLLLPSGGNIQLAGLGFSGNLVQDAFFDDYTSGNEGSAIGFYQLRQGISKNLTLEGSLQASPSNFQSQAGLVWRLASPVILSASVGNSRDRLAYSADLDVQLDKLEINANSQSLPKGYRRNTDDTNRYNHSLEAKYRFSNKFNLGFIARNRQYDGNSGNYILPTFSVRPFSTLSLNGRPDIDGDYLFNAFYRPNRHTRVSFNTYANAYISDLRYNLNDNYQMSFGSEFGRSLAPRYSIGFGHTPRSLEKLSWNLGLAYSDGEIGALAGASMRVIPGLFARVDYQGIPSRTKGSFGGFDNGRLSVSLVSDLSFAAGKVTPARYSGVNKERGAIAGNLQVEGGKQKFELDGSVVRVYTNASKLVGTARTDENGNFFVGNLHEGVYLVELEADALPIDLAVQKTSSVVEVASSAVTRLNFPLRVEYGVAGRITDVSGQPIPEVKIELINGSGVRVLSSSTDKFGLYRLDGVPVGNYTLRVSPQDSVGSLSNLPKRRVKVSREFVYEQNLQLPISAATKQKLVKQREK